jgi:[NiFe] hydrogenase small subunit
MVGGKTMLEIAQAVVPQAKHTICLGTCAAFGGLPAAAPNPTGAKGVGDALGIDTINITGCPPHPKNLVACITNYLLFGLMPPLLSDGRPQFCHGETIHQRCPTPHGCMQGYNCKGPQTYNNCHQTLYNEASWCIQVEHQCIGCSESGFWDRNAPFYNPMWASMFSTYRSEAIPHEDQTTASCTACHGSGIFEDQEAGADDPKRLQQIIHREHEINLQTNRSCAWCHPQAPDGTYDQIDD